MGNPIANGPCGVGTASLIYRALTLAGATIGGASLIYQYFLKKLLKSHSGFEPGGSTKWSFLYYQFDYSNFSLNIVDIFWYRKPFLNIFSLLIHWIWYIVILNISFRKKVLRWIWYIIILSISLNTITDSEISEYFYRNNIQVASGLLVQGGESSYTDTVTV